MMKKILLVLAIIFIIGRLIYVNNFTKNMHNAMNNTKIYSKKSNQFIFSPFNMNIEPMEKLMLIDFKDDPDKIYNCFEIQSFDDEKSGQGIRIIGYRNDNYVDVYQQPSLNLAQDFDQCGNGLADLVTVPLDDASFEINSKGVNSYFNFQDKNQREIKVIIKERSKRKTNPFNVLAPLGESSTDPSSLPIYMLYDFYFVRKDKTQVSIMIDGKIHTPDNFGMPLDGAKCYFTRYSGNPFLVHWNSSHKGLLNAIEVNTMDKVEDNFIEYDIVNNSGHFEIQSMKTKNEEHGIETFFSPAIPDITCLKDGNVKGNFTITFDKSAGSINGEYSIHRNDNKVIIKVIPNKGWKPNESRFMLKAMYTFVPVFKNWSKDYEWTANIELDRSDVAIMNSGWKRIERNQ